MNVNFYPGSPLKGENTGIEGVMTRDEWTRTITEQCQKAGVYQDYHKPIIETLAGTLEKRDEAEASYIEAGGKPTIIHISDRGSKNVVTNPALKIIMDLNGQAFKMWGDLGLTPAGLKKLNGDALTAKATTKGFEALLSKISEK